MFSRVVPKARRHVTLTDGREGLWRYVKSRKTIALPSGKVMSWDKDVRSIPIGELYRPLPGGEVCDVYVEFTMDRSPSIEEYYRYAPAMLFRQVTHNPTASGETTNGWEHRSRRSGWVTNPADVARKVTAK